MGEEEKKRRDEQVYRYMTMWPMPLKYFSLGSVYPLKDELVRLIYAGRMVDSRQSMDLKTSV